MTITLRTSALAGATTKNAPLTNVEVDQNFIDLKVAVDTVNTNTTTVTNIVNQIPDPVVMAIALG